MAKELYHGCIVKYNGYKTTKSGSTIDAICTGTVIGWDEQTIYTNFLLAGEKSGVCYYWDHEFIEPHMVSIDSRLGFHRSRLIEVIDDVKISINHKLLQSELF